MSLLGGCFFLASIQALGCPNSFFEKEKKRVIIIMGTIIAKQLDQTCK